MSSENREIILPSKLVIRPQTPEEEFNYLLDVLEETPFYKQNNYKIELSDHPEFQKIATGQTSLETVDKKRLRELFITEIYDPSFFDAGMRSLEQSRGQIVPAFPRFAEFNKQWGFKVFPEYQLTLTRYGPGGEYFYNEGRVVMMTRKDGTFKKPNPAHTGVHELVHIGIQSNIVEQLGLTHWEKERTVDRICMLKFGDILPNYLPNSKGDTRVDSFITEASLSDLPSAIGRYVNEYPRNSKSL